MEWHLSFTQFYLKESSIKLKKLECFFHFKTKVAPGQLSVLSGFGLFIREGRGVAWPAGAAAAAPVRALARGSGAAPRRRPGPTASRPGSANLARAFPRAGPVIWASASAGPTCAEQWAAGAPPRAPRPPSPDGVPALPPSPGSRARRQPPPGSGSLRGRDKVSARRPDAPRRRGRSQPWPPSSRPSPPARGAAVPRPFSPREGGVPAGGWTRRRRRSEGVWGRGPTSTWHGRGGRGAAWRGGSPHSPDCATPRVAAAARQRQRQRQSETGRGRVCRGLMERPGSRRRRRRSCPSLPSSLRGSGRRTGRREAWREIPGHGQPTPNMSIGDERGRTAERARRGRGPLPDLGAASSLLLRILRTLRILLFYSRQRPPGATQRWKPSARGVPSQC